MAQLKERGPADKYRGGELVHSVEVDVSRETCNVTGCEVVEGGRVLLY